MLLSADFPFRINVNIIYSNYSLNAAQLNKCLVTIFTGTVIKKSANSLQHCNVSYHNGCSTHTQTGANSLQQGENVTGCLTQIRVKYPTWGKFITAWEKCHITLAFRSRWGRNTPTHCHVTLEILQLGQTLTLVQECLWGQKGTSSACGRRAGGIFGRGMVYTGPGCWSLREDQWNVTSPLLVRPGWPQYLPPIS